MSEEQINIFKSTPDQSDNSDKIPSSVLVNDFQESVVDLKEFYKHNLQPNNSYGDAALKYTKSIFPLIKWLPKYSLIWLYNDFVAGISVGFCLVPQSMSYAKLAGLPVEYGLYSAFIGAFFYSLFASSKDVCIGPVAVASMQTAKAIHSVASQLGSDYDDSMAPLIATQLALYCGAIAAGIGFFRLGFLVEFISTVAIQGFVTGSAFNIAWGQVPGLLGYNSKVNSKTETYKVVINTLKHLPDGNINAVFGVIPLAFLLFIKYFCGDYVPKYIAKQETWSKKRKAIVTQINFYINNLRIALVIVVFTLISWGAWRNDKKSTKIKRLGEVPKGLRHVGVMKYDKNLSTKIAKEIPATVIVLILEHISISKNFGRISDYRIDPNQEILSIGVTNLIGTFFNAYPATGSFSRTSLKHKCNVSTPISGLFTGACVLLALYCFTKAFYFIPSATLCAVIISAVFDLVASYKTTWFFYKTSPMDFIGFIATVLITVFSSLDNGIYFAMCWSAAILLFNVAFPKGQFLGSVKVAEVFSPIIIKKDGYAVESLEGSGGLSFSSVSDLEEGKKLVSVTSVERKESDVSDLQNFNIKYHTKWVPLNNKFDRELNPDVEVIPPPEGVLVYRTGENWSYLNCSRHYDIVFDKVVADYQKGMKLDSEGNEFFEYKWNDAQQIPYFWNNFTWQKIKSFNPANPITTITTKPSTDSDSESVGANDFKKPHLKLVHFDFSSVTQVDTTSISTLVDLRKAIRRHCGDDSVEFHFSGIFSPWIRRSLINAGFGALNDENFISHSVVSYHIAQKYVSTGDDLLVTNETGSSKYYDLATGANLPFFHIDIPDFNQWNLS
ncbi:hypothetical protein QEN19_002087 [Hanseniaspora menglaensis]